jgi:hypothetical protein
MAKFIKSVHDRINFAIKKGLTGYIPPAKIDEEVHAESMNLWKKYIDEFERTQKISMYLKNFQAGVETVALTSGSGLMAVERDYITRVTTSDDKKVEIIEQGSWDDRINNPVKVPTTEYPVCMIYGSFAIQVRPTTVSQVKIWSLAKPTRPVYAYTVSGTRYVYDDANSVDIGWSEELYDEIMNRVLANIGLNMRELVLMQASQQEKMQEGK